MKPTKSLPVLFAAVMAITSGTAIATAQTAVDDGADGKPAASAQVNAAGSKGQRSHGRGHSFGGRGGSNMMQQIFQRIDVNDDGQITQEEVDTFRAAQVAAADASGDGALTIEEFDTVYRDLTRSRMVRAFQRLDVDGDGIISVEEMDNRFGSFVQKMDRNGDGALSMEDRSRGQGRKDGSNKQSKGGGRY